MNSFQAPACKYSVKLFDLTITIKEAYFNLKATPACTP
jgi:hypothetical protein